MFKHNSQGVDPNGGFPRLPPNQWYDFKITEAEEKMSSNNNPMIECTCKVINNPAFPDHEVQHIVTFLPKEKKGAGISVHFRKCINEPFGGDDEVDARNWVGKRFRGFVIEDSYTPKTGKHAGKTFKKDKISEIEAPTEPNLTAAELSVPF